MWLQEDMISQSMGDDLFIPPEDILLSNKIPLGSGSFGEVYHGYSYHQEVAIKRLFHGVAASVTWEVPEHSSDDPNQQVAFFQRNPTLFALEAETFFLKQLRHQNIISFLGCCLDPPVLVTEYCSKGSIYDLVQRVQLSTTFATKFDWKRRINMAVGAARGMNYLHSKDPPVLHKDLKSPNLLVDKTWTCKVADFGTCNFVNPQLKRACMKVNNPCWQAPEVLRGQEPTMASDVYPFGIILWELLMLRRPYANENGSVLDPTRIMAAVLLKDARPDFNGEDYDSTGCPVIEKYTSLMKRCWDKVPENRPTYEEILAELMNMKYEVHGRRKEELNLPYLQDLKAILGPGIQDPFMEKISGTESNTPFENGTPSRPFLPPFGTVSTEPSDAHLSLPIDYLGSPNPPQRNGHMVAVAPTKRLQNWFRRSFRAMTFCFTPRTGKFEELQCPEGRSNSTGATSVPDHRASMFVGQHMVMVTDVLNTESPFHRWRQQLSQATPFGNPPAGLTFPKGPASRGLVPEGEVSPDAAKKSITMPTATVEHVETQLLSGKLRTECIMEPSTGKEFEKVKNEDEGKSSCGSSESLSKTMSTVSDAGVGLQSHPVPVGSLLRDSLNESPSVYSRVQPRKFVEQCRFDLPGRHSLTIENLVSPRNPALPDNVDPNRVKSLVKAVSRVQSKCKTMGRGTGLRMVHQEPPTLEKWTSLREHILKQDLRESLEVKGDSESLSKFIEENVQVPGQMGWREFTQLVFGTQKNSENSNHKDWRIVTECMVGELGSFPPQEGMRSKDGKVL